MKKTNNITMLIVAAILSLGLINNTTHTAAARTPNDIARDFIIAMQNNDYQALTTLQKQVDYQLVLDMAIKDENVNLIRTLINKGIAYIDTFFSIAKNGDLKAMRIFLAA